MLRSGASETGGGPGWRIRDERPASAADRGAIRRALVEAFGRPDEADLVGRLRAEETVLVSFVAEVDGSVVGHVLFSRMWIETADGEIPAAALAPLAVVPAFQRRGFGG